MQLMVCVKAVLNCSSMRMFPVFNRLKLILVRVLVGGEIVTPQGKAVAVLLVRNEWRPMVVDASQSPVQGHIRSQLQFLGTKLRFEGSQYLRFSVESDVHHTDVEVSKMEWVLAQGSVIGRVFYQTHEDSFR